MIIITGISYSLLVIFMLWVMYQDFKSRTINLYIAIGIFIASSVVVINAYSFNWVIGVMSYNLLLLAVFYGALLLYFSVKGVSVSEVFNNKLGIGDVVFTMAIIPCFTTTDLLVFLLLSFLFSIIVYQTLKFLNKNKSLTIPLAGNMALFFIITQVLIKLDITEPINSLV